MPHPNVSEVADASGMSAACQRLPFAGGATPADRQERMGTRRSSAAEGTLTQADGARDAGHWKWGRGGLQNLDTRGGPGMGCTVTHDQTWAEVSQTPAPPSAVLPKPILLSSRPPKWGGGGLPNPIPKGQGWGWGWEWGGGVMVPLGPKHILYNNRYTPGVC